MNNLDDRYNLEDDDAIYDGVKQGCLGMTAFMCAIIIIALLCILSCKSQRIVEKPVVITEVHTDTVISRDTVDIFKWKVDSVYVKDSVWSREWIRNDTVFIEINKTHNEFRSHVAKDSVRHVSADTLRIHDSIPYPVEVKATEYVEKKLNWFQEAAMWIGYIVMIVLFGLLLKWLITFWKNQ